MDSFYTNVFAYGDRILFRGIENGKRVDGEFYFKPKLYLEDAKHDASSKFKSFSGTPLKEIEFDSIKSARNFMNQYSDAGVKIHGNENFVSQFLAEKYRGDVDWDTSKINVAYIDIETEVGDEFPDAASPDQRINAITLYISGDIHVFSFCGFSPDKMETNYSCNLIHYEFDNESDLLSRFVEVWQSLDIDVVSGWYISDFDIPYIINRINKVLGNSYAKKLSPWGIIKDRTVTIRNKQRKQFDLCGISTLDYYNLYLKYTYGNLESYALQYVSYHELGESKVDYSEHDNIKEFYENDYQKFIEYNIKDVMLVKRLNDKMMLFDLIYTMAYSAKCNYIDVFSQTRTWDSIIYNYLLEHDIQIPPKDSKEKNSQYIGAYVKEPVTAMYRWVVSFDVASMYPHIIMESNISPETYRGQYDMSVDVESMISQSTDLSRLPQNTTITPNGAIWDTSFEGILSTLMKKYYNMRTEYKNMQIECEQKLVQTENKDFGGDVEKLKSQIAKYKIYQMATKIAINSMYGSLGTPYFRYYNEALASAVTTMGQLAIKKAGIDAENYIRGIMGDDPIDNCEQTKYLVYIDTDAIYLNMGPIVDRYMEGRSTDDIVKFLDEACVGAIEPLIAKSFAELGKYLKVRENSLKMKREIIADRMMWTGKKRYIASVWDNEGVRYQNPKIKIMGLETERSSTPEICRNKLREAIEIIMTQTENDLVDFVSSFRKEFFNSSPGDISFPRGVNGIKKYRKVNGSFPSGTPIHVRGSIVFNEMLNSNHDLHSKYNVISDASKIRFLYLIEPNPTGSHVISFPSNWPKEFDLDRYIDYNKMFEKSFLEPLESIVNVIGWSCEKTASLSSVFV